MTDVQLATWAKVIVASMEAGDMAKVTEIYGKISSSMTMEEAAKLEQLIAAFNK